MKSQAGRIRVLIVDDHAAVRRGLRHLLSGFPDMEVVGEAEDGPGAERLAAAVSPDVVLLDMHLRGPNGLDVAAKLRQACTGARFILLSSDVDLEALGRSALNRFESYLHKSDSDEYLAAAIRAVYRGERWTAPKASYAGRETAWSKTTRP